MLPLTPGPVPDSPPSFGLVAFAASAGGLSALSQVLGALPADFGLATAVVQHLLPNRRSYMAEILGQRTALVVRQAIEGEHVLPGHVYLAPPDRHLIANPDGTLSLTHEDLVNFTRPSADLLFESLASSYRSRGVAVILTGTGHDGARGAAAVRHAGGVVIAQDEATSEFFGMPGAAIDCGAVEWILPIEKIARALIALTMAGAAP